MPRPTATWALPSRPGEVGRGGRLLPPGLGAEAGLRRGPQQPGRRSEGPGKLDEAVACYRRALELKPDFAAAHSNLCSRSSIAPASPWPNSPRPMPSTSGCTPRRCAAGAEWGRHHCKTPGRSAIVPARRGFASGSSPPDLGRHPVGFFLIRPLENLDRGQCETVCYCDRRVQDDMTARLQAAAALWRDVAGLSDEQLADQIRADRIDVLFDLAGHTADNRLLVFARKPAPIQVTWCGYAGTTGPVGDGLHPGRPLHHPARSPRRYYCERVLRMPDGLLCFEPPGDAPPVSPLPAMENGHVTLCRVPQSAQDHAPGGGGLGADPGAIAGLAAGAEVPRDGQPLGGGPAGGRCSPAGESIRPAGVPRLLGRMLRGSADYHRVDVALDTFPYNGCMTTCEALWMGVPVVTCPGETFASRYSLSHLSNVGLTETIARDLDDYVEIAAGLAGDLPRLAALRAGLRERMAASPLCDGKRFAASFAGSYAGSGGHGARQDRRRVPHGGHSRNTGDCGSVPPGRPIAGGGAALPAGPRGGPQPGRRLEPARRRPRSAWPARRRSRCFYRAVALRPDWAEALFNLGWAFGEQGKCDRGGRLLPASDRDRTGLRRGARLRWAWPFRDNAS